MGEDMRIPGRGNYIFKGSEVPSCGQGTHSDVTTEREMRQEVALENLAQPTFAKVFFLPC